MKYSAILQIASIVFSLCFLVTGCQIEAVPTPSNPYSSGQVATLSKSAQVEPSLQPTFGIFMTPEPTPTLSPSILLQDDFSDPTSGWETSGNEYGKAGYQQGGYLVEAYQQKQYYWGVAGEDFDNIRIDVDARVLQSPTDKNDAFGVDCRIQPNGDGYGFRVSSDGFFALVLYEDTNGIELVDWTASDAIYTYGPANTLTAICQGNHFQFLVNGLEVLNTVDDTFSRGDIALSVISYTPEPISILFDDIVVRKLGIPLDALDQQELILRQKGFE